METNSDKFITFSELLEVIKRKWMIIVLIAFACFLLGVLFLSIRSIPYTAEATVSVESIAELTNYLRLAHNQQSINSELQILTYTSTLEKTLSKLELSSYKKKFGSDYSNIFITEAKKKNFKNAIKTNSLTENTVKIQMTHGNQEFTRDFLGSLICVFNTELHDEATRQLADEKRLLVTQLEIVNNNLQNTNQSFEDFLNKLNTTSLSMNSTIQGTSNEITQNILTFLELKKESATAHNDLTNQSEIFNIRRLLEEDDGLLVESYKNAYRVYLYESLLKTILLSSTGNETTNFNQDDEIQGTLDYFSSQLFENLALKIPDTSLEKVYEEIIRSIESTVIIEEETRIKDDIKQLPLLEQQKYAYIEKANNLFSLSLQLTQKLDLLNSFLESIKQPVKVLDNILVTKAEHSSFKLLVLALGLIIGILLGGVIVIFGELSSKTINSIDGYVHIFENKIPILGIVPVDKVKKGQPRKFYNELDFDKQNTYNRMAGIFLSGHSPAKNNLYCVSSIRDRTRSTTAVFNLALSLVSIGQKVVVLGIQTNSEDYQGILKEINSNLSCSEYITYKEINNSFEFLPPNEDFPLAFCHLNLSSSIELSATLKNEEFIKFVDNLSMEYDIVLIDSPAYNNPIDNLLVARISNGLIVSLALGLELKKEVKSMVHTYSLSKIPIVGLILINSEGKTINGK